MSSNPSPAAERVTVATESALSLTAGRATVLFGIGPAFGEGAGTRRMDRVLRALAPDLMAIRWAHQVHGTELAVVDGPEASGVGTVGDFDALSTSVFGLGLVVWTADCVPVALVGPHAVAMVHAGWRGSAGGVVPTTVTALQREFGTWPADLCAVLGPSISGAHYQVGPEVVNALGGAGVDRPEWLDHDRVDLRVFLAQQLSELGVADVHVVGPCTFATPEFASFRRDGDDAGRQWSMVYLQETDEPGRSGS